MNNTQSVGASTKLAYSVKEAADLLGVSTKSIRRAVERGQLPVCRKFRHLLIAKVDLEKFLGIGTAPSA